MARIIIGNLISLFSSVFLFASSIARDARKTYLFQGIECIVLFVAQVVFLQPAAAFCLLLAMVRNVLLFYNKYNTFSMILIASLTAVLGAAFNSGGAVGLIPVVAATLYCITTYFAKDFVVLKIVVTANLLLWIIYSALIYDFAATLINFGASVLSVMSIIHYIKERKGKGASGPLEEENK